MPEVLPNRRPQRALLVPVRPNRLAQLVEPEFVLLALLPVLHPMIVHRLSPNRPGLRRRLVIPNRRRSPVLQEPEALLVTLGRHRPKNLIVGLRRMRLPNCRRRLDYC